MEKCRLCEEEMEVQVKCSVCREYSCKFCIESHYGDDWCIECWEKEKEYRGGDPEYDPT